MLIFGLQNSFGQTTNSVYLYKITDDMSGEIFIIPNRFLIVANETGKKGFRIQPAVNENEMTFRTLIVEMVGIGNCNENDEIIILFENGEKITKKSWNTFNCEGTAYFDFTELEINLLRKHPISKIRMTNGRSYDSYTGDLKETDKRYFIQFFYALDNKLTFKKNRTEIK